MRRLLFFVGLEIAMGGCGPPLSKLIAADSESEQPLTQFPPELGVGVDAAETQLFAKCVNFDPPTTRPLGLSKRFYDEQLIKTRLELDQSLGVDTQVKASSLWGTISTGASYFRNVTLNDESMFWLVNARYETDAESIDMGSSNFSLTPQAQELLDAEGLEAFTNACGTHFYSGRVLGGRYSLLYEFKASENRVLEKLKVDASYEGFGITADAKFSEALQAARHTSS